MNNSTCRSGFIESLESRTLLSLAGIDHSFSGDGSATYRFTDSQSTIAEAMDVGRGGKIIVAGTTRGRDNSQILLGRLNANGTVDSSFGKNGRVITNIPGPVG